ncbi:MAG TPA: hypothetical protein VM576_01215 [Xanthomonadaceae bacterium]|nr:hypothetical protein [Xanthomonadaceae bacterium]
MAAPRLPRRFTPTLALALLLVACGAPSLPFAQLSGVLLDRRLDEVSGLAASRVHADTLWALNDGGNAPVLYAIGKRGGLRAQYRVRGVANTDWEDLSAFELDGRHYLLIADTGDNGGLRHTVQLHVVEEPRELAGGTLVPAWSVAFRWPDGARDCEAVAVDAARGQVLLVSKKRRPPELFVLPLRPKRAGLQVARRVGRLAGVPAPDPDAARDNPRAERLLHQPTAADLAPDGRTLAVLTYSELLLYRRRGDEGWARAVARRPAVHPLPWLPQAEALAWTPAGQALYATGESRPAPLFYLNP